MKHSSEPQPKITTSSPFFAKPNVTCCPVLYMEAVDYASWLVLSNKSQINAYDLVHDLIAYQSLNLETYKAKIKSHFLISIRLKAETEKSLTTKRKGTDFHQCKICQEQLPECAYRVAYLQNGLEVLRTTCKKCESLAAILRRKKRDEGQSITTCQKYYNKHKSNPDFMEKRAERSKIQMRQLRNERSAKGCR